MTDSAIDQFAAADAAYAENFPAGLPSAPTRRVAVLTCMDSRLHPTTFLGLAEGEAHVLRNAGGLVTEDALRSLAMSQRLLGTRSVMLIQHTQCGMAALQDNEFRDQIETDCGQRPAWPAFDFGADADVNVTLALAELRACPYLPHRDDIRGFVFDVETGRLNEVTA